ncbi:GGDEF domain-containing protein [Gilvimarinus sp. SDUM040013]|uniref:diguanylate cyclase n=1 Tax=Gilvimarinus gilvus TaxID=3058038 RepID=A0ABU4RXI5_9GAMM|nr:GGDEF domain-containing protein [Gilvimarinus sp. SDUM040013]MDO3385739.1 GGDEF domain-containing protein [Gilvimarinus sp. SDUM040013]MDX6849379.1 GGDEF domain-containing protein [Gilvimarinus sp. SDUM040013]
MTEKDANHRECPACGPECPYKDEVLCLRNELEALKMLARTDALTELFNYRHFKETLANEIERVRRSNQPMGLVIGDVDHFKSFNDRYGHELGNVVLKQVAKCIDRNLRKLDIACRYGGEEFALILPGTNIRQAERIAERVRQAIEQDTIHCNDGDELHVTMSLGVSVFSSERNCTPEQLVASADAQLYQAKEAGRNRSCVEKLEKVTSTPVTQEEKAALFALLNADEPKADSEE